MEKWCAIFAVEGATDGADDFGNGDRVSAAEVDGASVDAFVFEIFTGGEVGAAHVVDVQEIELGAAVVAIAEVVG